MTQTIFKGGQSIKADVDALLRALADRGEGDLITYEEVATLTKLKVGTPRFDRVFKAFRDSRFRELGHQWRAEPGIGYRILTPAEAVAHNTKGLINTSRAVGRVAVRIEATDHTRLTPAEMGRQMLLRRTAFALSHAAKESITTLEAPPRTVSDQTDTIANP